MGETNELIYLKEKIKQVDGSILEIGSKEYYDGQKDLPQTSSFREYFPGNEYIGIDIEPGKGVDSQVDLTKGIEPFQENYFSLVICTSVLEHVAQPWVMAENITKILTPEGKLYISVPWVHRYHPYPDDYYRFSPQGIKAIFPELVWGDIYYSTTIINEYMPFEPLNKNGNDNRMSVIITRPEGRQKFMPNLLVHMLGTKVLPDSHT